MTRSALPTFANSDTASFTVVFFGGTTATGTLLGQVDTFSWTDSKEKKTTIRLGDSTTYKTYTAEDVTWDISIFEDNDLQEPARLMGSTIPTAGGWLGSEDIQLATSDASTTITVARYSTEATSATLLWTETLSTVYVEEMTHSVKDGKWNAKGSAANILVEPTAALGA